MRILIVDDHPLVLVGLRAMLEQSGYEIGEAATGSGALEALRRRRWDVLVLDLGLPDRDGLDLLEEIVQAYPDLRVLVLTLYEPDHFAPRSIRAGAAGFITKDAPPSELLDAIRRVARGERYLPHGLAERLAFRWNERGAGAPHERLSNREFQVMRLLASGRTVAQVSAQLALSPKTVSTYRARLLEKMALQSNAELTFYALQRGLVRGDDL